MKSDNHGPNHDKHAFPNVVTPRILGEDMERRLLRPSWGKPAGSLRPAGNMRKQENAHQTGDKLRDGRCKALRPFWGQFCETRDDVSGWGPAFLTWASLTPSSQPRQLHKGYEAYCADIWRLEITYEIGRKNAMACSAVNARETL